MKLKLTNTSLRKLQIFKSVVENNGFSAAQADLNTSATSISIQMKELESQLGMTLCERGRTGFKLTDRGRAAYAATKTLFASLDNFTIEIANIREELVGEICIGLQDNVSTCPGFKMPETLDKFNQRKNIVQLRIEEAASSEQEARTLEGRYNLAVGIFNRRIPGLTYQKLFDEEIALYCAKGHPLFDKPDSEIRLEELQHEKFASAGSLQEVVTHSKEFTRKPDAIAENMDATSLLLLSGHYIGFIPIHFANIWVERGQMRVLLPEKTTCSTEFYMITRKGGTRHYAVDVFIRDLLSCHDIKSDL